MTDGDGNAEMDDAEKNEVVGAVSTAAQRLGNAQSESEVLDSIVGAAVQTVPGAEQAGVSLLYRDGGISSAATSHDTVNEVDRLQAEHREGPCVTALWDEHTVTVDDMAVEMDRWPRFAPEAAERGVASMLSFQLFARDGSMGALNLYASNPKSFPTESQLVGGLFATHAATALGEARTVAQMQEAVATRDVIGQAKGMLMERFGLDAEAAFQLLIRSSQDTNLKLVAVARWLTGETGQLPGHNPGRDGKA